MKKTNIYNSTEEPTNDDITNNPQDNDVNEASGGDKSFLTPYDKAAIYARKSIKTDSHSIGSQIARGMEVINENKLILYNVYSDSESSSKYAYTKRAGFLELLSDMEKGKFKTLVVLKRDRLSRRFNELLEIKKRFKKHNIKVIYSSHGEYQPTDDYFSDFVENIIMGISELEPKQLDERTSNGRKIKREKGLYSKTGDIPFGLTDKSEESNGEYEAYTLFPHEIEAPILKEIFLNFLNNNLSIPDIMKQYPKSKANNKNLTDGVIRYMFTNSTYVRIRPKCAEESIFILDEETNRYVINWEAVQVFKDIYPVIDQNLFFKVALKYLNNKRRNNPRVENYLFKNLLICNTCKKNITLCNPYYRCSNCKTSYKKAILLRTLFQQILSDLINEENLDEVKRSFIRGYKANIANKKTSIKRTKEEKEKKLLEFVETKEQIELQIDLKELIEKEFMLLEEINYFEDKIDSLENIHQELVVLKSLSSYEEIHKFLLNPNNVNKVQELLTKIIENVNIERNGDKYEAKINYGAIPKYSE